MIDWNKPIRYINNNVEVRFLGRVNNQHYPIVLAMKYTTGQETVFSVTEDGGSHVGAMPCIENIPEETFVYLNVYEYSDEEGRTMPFGVAEHRSREVADLLAKSGRVACLKVKIERGRFDE